MSSPGGGDPELAGGNLNEDFKDNATARASRTQQQAARAQADRLADEETAELLAGNMRNPNAGEIVVGYLLSQW